MFGVQRSSVKLVDRTLHVWSFGQWSTTHGEIIAKAALGEGGLDPSVRRAVSRRTRPFPEPAPRRGWLAELEAEALLLSDLQTSPSEAQCARREFQCIVVCARLAFVDLPKDGRGVLDCFHFQAKQADPRAL